MSAPFSLFAVIGRAFEQGVRLFPQVIWIGLVGVLAAAALSATMALTAPELTREVADSAAGADAMAAFQRHSLVFVALQLVPNLFLSYVALGLVFGFIGARLPVLPSDARFARFFGMSLGLMAAAGLIGTFVLLIFSAFASIAMALGGALGASPHALSEALAGGGLPEPQAYWLAVMLVFLTALGVVLVAAFWLMGRTLLMQTHAMVENRLTVRPGWALTDGIAWRVLSTFLVALVAVVLVTGLASAPFALVPGAFGGYLAIMGGAVPEVWPAPSIVTALAAGVVVQVFNVFAASVMAVVLAEIYQALRAER